MILSQLRMGARQAKNASQTTGAYCPPGAKGPKGKRAKGQKGHKGQKRQKGQK